MEVITMDETKKAGRDFKELSEEEQKNVLAKKEKLNFKDTTSIISFGAEDANDLSEFSSTLFKGFNISTFAEFEGTMTNLMNNLKQVDPETLMEKNKSKWEGIPFIGPLFKKEIVDKVNAEIIKHTTIEKSIEQIITTLEKTKMSMMKDMKFSLEMREKAYKYADAQELNFLAVGLAKEDAEKEKKELEMNSNPNDLKIANQLADISNSIDSLERKETTIQSYRLMSLQNLPKLTYIHNASEAIVTKIDDVIINVIPQWSSL